MKILLSHLTGNANVKSAADGFIEAGMLAEFHVTIATVPGSMLDRLAGLKIFSELRRRRFNPSVKPFLRTWPWFEAGRILAEKGGFNKLTQQGSGTFHVDAVVQNLDRHVADSLKYAIKKGVTAVYGYEDTTIFTFREAKRLGLQCLYDLPIGYWRTAHRLLDAERQRWPEWIPTMPGFSDWDEKLSRKEEELQLADRIFVASTFTANSLKDFPGILAPIQVIPYGFPPVSDEPKLYPDFNNGRPLKLLFVGSLSQRKGIADLFSAVEYFGEKVTLTVVGSKTTQGCAVLEKALAKHRYIPGLPHHEILRLMREHDVFVFPSLFEGFGLVITEAMSQGTPVITTERTAGPDLIENDKNGWLIEAGSTIALKNAIGKLLQDPGKIEAVGRAALETARLRPWEMYGRELAAAINRID
ncbi:MAG: glycosyltransferase family 4 protein [Ferruginibacter sp.]|nr:glycosyltransferase family 4 protein [Ferruginibacter sp.]